MPDQTHAAAPKPAKKPDVARSETTLLISADKVEGTSVYDTAGKKLGAIDTVMIDKDSGRIAYAVLSFGGFLGIGKSHYPLPWNRLRYDTERDGYVVSITEAQLKDAPNGEAASGMSWSDPAWTSRIDRHYPMPTAKPAGH